MAHNADKLGPLGRMTVQELGWAQRDIISVPPEMAAIDAMRKMQVAADGVCTPRRPPTSHYVGFLLAELAQCARCRLPPH
jgi:hypothetical protein